MAAILSAYEQDVRDTCFLLALLIINGLVAFYEEHKAGNAIDALKASLAPKVRPDPFSLINLGPFSQLGPFSPISLTDHLMCTFFFTAPS